MKRAWMVCLSAVALVSTSAMANADLAKSKNCLTCHSVSNKVIGPSFKDVAAKYSGQKDAENKLVQRVLKGSSGVWGGPSSVMPANMQVSEAEAHTLVKWVLSQK
ncbi:c-type cytochrome [Oxalobacteraceae bacterium R-40]|uniref:C-type cytochrome n=1 Tax=Keguizhuia sedimenti TaxID=3064264 RepID=A0ABU1BLQ4_9BURK|nr:c-type cytochrome [Oxalobacteraceae bacterium R-40]